MNWRSRLLEEQSVSCAVMTPEIWSEDCCEYLLLATLVTHAYFHFMQTGSRFHFHTQTRSKFLVGTRVSPVRGSKLCIICLWHMLTLLEMLATFKGQQ